MRRGSAALAALAICAAMAAPAAADVRLSTTTSKPVKLKGAKDPAFQYDQAEYMTLDCRGGATPVMVGWKGARTPIAMIYSHLVESHKQMGLAVRRPMTNGRLRGITLCVAGAKVIQRASRDGEGTRTVSCPSGRLAIGVPIDGGPYYDHAIVTKPQGLRGWENNEGRYSRAKVNCVPAGAFGRPQLVRGTARFATGKATTTVKATCRGGRRPIGWGFEAGTLDENAWNSVESATSMTVPFIATAKPAGRSGWALTFATPDGRPARTSTDLVLHLTCAVPR